MLLLCNGACLINHKKIPDRRSKQAEKVVIALAQRTIPEDGQIIMTETCRGF